MYVQDISNFDISTYRQLRKEFVNIWHDLTCAHCLDEVQVVQGLGLCLGALLVRDGGLQVSQSEASTVVTWPHVHQSQLTCTMARLFTEPELSGMGGILLYCVLCGKYLETKRIFQELKY